MDKQFRIKQEEETIATVGRLKGLKILSVYDVQNMMVGALEGGSNYWYEIAEETDYAIEAHIEKHPEIRDYVYVDQLLHFIVKGGKVQFLDRETKDRVGELAKWSIRRGEQVMLQDYRRHFGDLLAENDDAITADVFLQCAVMGEVVYG